MSTNLESSPSMAFNGSAVTAALSQMDKKLLTLRGTGQKTFNGLIGNAKAFNDALGGLDGLDKLNKAFGSPISMEGMKAVINDNLTFESSLQRIKFNANLANEALAEMKKTALDVSKSTLTSPQKLIELQGHLVDAKIKAPDIKLLTPTIATAAHVSGAAPAEVADLAADMVNKFGITIERMPQMLDMLYANGQDGGLGLSNMSKQSPVLFNATQHAGITGEKGLSLMAAMTQRLNNVAINDPGKVAGLTKKGLSSITDPATVKKLGAMGVDVKNYVDDKGLFKGDGGVDGFLGLSLVMKARGLDNSAKMAEAGIGDPDAATFWREMMNAADANGTEEDPSLDSAMETNTLKAESKQLEKNMDESRNSNSGKIAGAKIELEKVKLSQPASAMTGLAASAAEWAGNNKKSAAMLAVGGVMAATQIRKKLAGKTGGGKSASAADGASGVQKVFVTNFPGSMLSPKEQLEKKRERTPGSKRDAPIPGEPVKIPGKLARFAGGAKTGLKIGAPMAIGLGLIQAMETANDDTMTKEAKATEYKRIAGGTIGSVAGGVIGGAVGALFGGVGAVPGAMIGSAVGNWGGEKIAAMFEGNKAMVDKMANTTIPVAVTVSVENGNIVGAVNTAQDKKALRH